MNCLMCLSSISILQKFQRDENNDTFKKINFVFPEFEIPKSQDPFFMCSTCLEQVAYFFKIKKTCLDNLFRLKHYDGMLNKKTELEVKDKKIITNSTDISTQQKQTDSQINSDYIEILPSEDEDDSNSTSNNSNDNNKPKTQLTSIEREFKCTDCHKIFIRKSDLKRHIRIHTGERPFKCPTCPKSFTQAAALSKHLITVHAEKIHECEICHKMFGCKITLTKHIPTHYNLRPHQCEFCKKTFTQTGTLRRHKRLHTQEKLYECHICEYKCVQEYYLKRHIKAHIGRKS